MEEFTGELYQHDALVAYLVVRLDAASGAGVLVPHDEVELEPGGGYTLVADDGRRGTIVLGAVEGGGDRVSAAFALTSPFGE